MLSIKNAPGEPFFVSIVSANNRTPEQAAAEIEEQHLLSGLENFAVSFPLQPQGTEPLRKAEYYALVFRRLQAARKNPALKVGPQQRGKHGSILSDGPAFSEIHHRRHSASDRRKTGFSDY